MSLKLLLENVASPDRNIIPSFSRLDRDPWMPPGMGSRKRALSRVKTPDGNELIWKHDGKFFQQPEHNPLNGGKKREYKSIEEEVAYSEWMRGVVLKVHNILELPLETILEVHQLRVSCLPGIFGHPAPEGRHRDGRRYIAIAHVHQQNINGGVTQLFYSEDSEDPFLEHRLNSGEILVFSD